MRVRLWLGLTLLSLCLALTASDPARSCCPAGPRGKPVVNADQTVIILWDAATKTQHFIRQASFKSEADDFGFLVPSPSQPELEESGNDAFPRLRTLTEPEVKIVRRGSGGGGCGCVADKKEPTKGDKEKDKGPEVKVLQEKLVAGFQAAVLETNSAAALVAWLKDHGYAYSPEVEAWAKPYVEAGWKITAMKVAKDKDAKENKSTTAAALRMSFKTDRPLFPYREPDFKSAADSLGAKRRLLRIYFIGEARYQGELTKDTPWTGTTAWAGKLGESDRTAILGALNSPRTPDPRRGG
jgi:hypothetical protein